VVKELLIAIAIIALVVFVIAYFGPTTTIFGPAIPTYAP
jgi:hypothetical protein